MFNKHFGLVTIITSVYDDHWKIMSYIVVNKMTSSATPDLDAAATGGPIEKHTCNYWPARNQHW